MTTTAVPTIRQTIENVLRNGGYASYASMGVVDQIVAALQDREQALYGDVPTSAPAPSEAGSLASAVEQNEAVPVGVGERLRALEEQVARLTEFALANGYRA